MLDVMRRMALPFFLAAFVAAAIPAQADTDRQSRTFPYPSNKPIEIEIAIGAVRIEGWSRREVTVEIVRHTPDRAALSRIPIEMADGDTLVIRARQSDGGLDPQLRSDVTLRVPHDATLRAVRVVEGRLDLVALHGAVTADVRRGPIHATDLRGVVRLETSIGDIDVERSRLTPGGLLRLRAFNGDITLSLAERPADARVMALALNGTIRSEIPLRMKDTWGPRWGEATLGQGEPVISIDVITGRITIKAPA